MSIIGNSNHEIFIVDDDATICESLSAIFAFEGYRVMAFKDATSFIAAARTKPPSCVLLDVQMPGKSGLEILRDLDARHYPAPILMISGHGDIPTAVMAMKDGACGFIEKGLDADAMIARVRETINGWSGPRLHNGHTNGHTNGNGAEPTAKIFPGDDRLTPREREVLSQITAAASNKEAANNLGISRRTVEVHRIHIMQKLGAKNAVDLIRIVLSKGVGK